MDKARHFWNDPALSMCLAWALGLPRGSVGASWARQGPEGQAMWHDLLVASALVFVIEGVWPFLSPDGVRRAMLTLAEADDRTLRVAGLVSMVTGVALLYWVN